MIPVDPTSEIPVPGVRALEHTADVGLEVEGGNLQELFLRGSLGAMWLVLERGPGELDWPVGPHRRDVGTAPFSEPMADGALKASDSVRAGSGEEVRTLGLSEEDLPALFRSWLRALLFWEETEGFVTVDASLAFLPVPVCSTPDGQAFGLEARVRGIRDHGPRVREIKGVTFHGLVVERQGEGWCGRVIFDV